MKTLFLIIALVAAATLPAQTDLATITRTLGAGNAADLVRHFDASATVSLEEEQYARAQASAALQAFFAKNAARGFSIVHEGTSKGSDAKYCIGDLTTASGTYRVYIYMKVVGGQYTIQQLRFDRS